jgi:hypothetical protein
MSFLLATDKLVYKRTSTEGPHAPEVHRLGEPRPRRGIFIRVVQAYHIGNPTSTNWT